MRANKSLHRFDNGFIPTASPAHDRITVRRNSPLISGVSRKGPGQYRIDMGSFIGGGGRDATAEEAAEYMSQSPHWAVLMRLTKGARMGPSCFGEQMKSGWLP